MDKKQVEKYSSAFTLSDMEIYIFPELLFSLVLANILSPEIWKWREDPWFSGISKMSPLKRIHRVKQYIMDHYDFNLDLETWGLTDKQTEINRFRDFINISTLEQSNALFGYEGDKYYFDLDIRTHFGLDKYDTDVLPYWKTETVEAMNAFRYKEGHSSGAGECVSLSCLYAAALFIVAEIPLEKIFIMGTPLHSQNFILVDEGVITNNRRIVTKPMWFNGTELSALARRALEHERITMVAHSTGHIHVTYPEATIDEKALTGFRQALSKYLETQVSFDIFTNFLRSYSKYQHLFQLAFPCSGLVKYIKMEKVFAYEHDSKYKVGQKSVRKLLCDIDEEDLLCCAEKNRSLISIDDPLFQHKTTSDFLSQLPERFPEFRQHEQFLNDLRRFIHTVPKLPSSKKNFSSIVPIEILPSQKREEIFWYLSGIRDRSITADLAFYAGRYMDTCKWEPFLKAAFERNPVAVEYFRKSSLEEVFQELSSWSDESIYDGNRLALPDEVVNFHRGDGSEKAITFINITKTRRTAFSAEQKPQIILVSVNEAKFEFPYNKQLKIPLQLI